MEVKQQEWQRLKQVKSIVRTYWPKFGLNKRQEITRLLYEISKREEISPHEITRGQIPYDYTHLKKHLLQRRYPYAFSKNEILRPYLPKIELKTSDVLQLKEQKYYPKKVFIETKVKDTYLARRFKEIFSKASFSEISSLKDYLYQHRKFGIEDYNRRQNKVFIISENYDYFKKCPCSRYGLGCGYYIFNLGFGCVFECNYCFLQTYTNSPGIILPANIDSFFDKFKSYQRPGMRIGTGEFLDSLALDEITQYSLPIVDFFYKQKDVTFEFKTKSANIKNILKTKPGKNIVISWSLNPQKVINENEFYTASLAGRLAAAKKCIEAGFKVGFHFDPVIYFGGWQTEYKLLIENLFQKIRPEHIAWVSIGTFRFPPALKQTIERRFPQNKILDAELLIGYDNKLRYPYMVRYNIYKKIIEQLSGHSRKLKIYLCMEELSMWKNLKLKRPRL